MPEEILIEEMQCVYQKPGTLTDDYMHYCPGCGHAVAHKILMEVVEEMGLQDLPKEKQEEILVKMTEVLLKKIYLETFEKLGEIIGSSSNLILDSQSINASLNPSIVKDDNFISVFFLPISSMLFASDEFRQAIGRLR